MDAVLKYDASVELSEGVFGELGRTDVKCMGAVRPGNGSVSNTVYASSPDGRRGRAFKRRCESVVNACSCMVAENSQDKDI